MASTGTRLTRTTVGSVTNQYKWTYSFWVKRSLLGDSSTNNFVFDWYQSGSNRGGILFETNDTFKIYDRVSNSNVLNRNTNRRFRDTNAWYHIVVAHDRTVSSPLTKIYINGVEETSFSASSDPSQNGTSYFNTTSQTETIGSYGNATDYSQMIMSHVHFCDGYYYQASDFGETDSTTREWKIKTSPSVSYGNNGYFILKDGNSLTDQSPNTNNFTVAGGTLTKTEDCPSNVFCTMNPLDKSSSLNLSNGNTRTASPSNNWMPCKGTIGMIGQNGKFYWEGKCESGTNHYFGVYDASGTVRGSVQSDMDSNRFVYVYDGGMERTITGQSAISGGTYATFANNDIIGVALDKENGTITFYKNGTQIYTETHSSLQTKDLIPGTQAYGSDIQWNFGNGYFGTTAVSSAGTNASGNGIFEYDVPTGYTALSTKGLNL